MRKGATGAAIVVAALSTGCVRTTSLGCSDPAEAAPGALDASADAGTNVILVTLDGVRWQEFYGGPDAALGVTNGGPDPALGARDGEPVFARFWASLAAGGRVFDGDVANPIHLSLPGYQSIFAGSTRPCGGNDCGRIGVTTFPERLVARLGLGASAIASFASWGGLADAIQSRPGATRVDAPDGGAMRPDWRTFAEARGYLERERPRFLFIGLGDADEEGHARRYDRYLAALRDDDRWLGELTAALDGMGAYGERTALLVTTDHGRGEGARWTDHGAAAVGDADRRIWMFVRLPRSGAFAFAEGSRRVSHLDVRPTVEVLFGLAPDRCAACGESLVVPAREQGSSLAGSRLRE